MPNIVDKLIALIKIDNEENVILCIKTIMEILKFGQTQEVLANKIQSFLDLVRDLYKSMPNLVHDTFDAPAPLPAAQAVPTTPSTSQLSQSPHPGSPAMSLISNASGDLGSDAQTTRHLPKGVHSFRVYAEVPIVFVSLLQVNRNLLNKNTKAFIPLMKSALVLQAKHQEKAHQDAKAQGKVFTGVSKEIRNRAAFGDFVSTQVKTLSFFAYLVKYYPRASAEFLPTLPDVLVRLLRDCPREKSSSRKELLIAFRHICTFAVRDVFLKVLEDLLDEDTLLGDGLTVHETMRPLAFSTVADLIHHSRDSLTKEQIQLAIDVFLKHFHDNCPGTSFQTMSVRLLFNLTDLTSRLQPRDEARYLLMSIVRGCADKFAVMNDQFHSAMKVSAHHQPPSIDAVAEDHMPHKDQPPDWDEVSIADAAPIKTTPLRDKSSDPVGENNFLFKNIVSGLKNLVYQLRACNPPGLDDDVVRQFAPPNWGEASHGFNAEEVGIFIKLFREGVRVFRYYGPQNPFQVSNMTPPEILAAELATASGKEEKELLEQFATIFHTIDPATFHEVFASEIPRLYELMFEHPAVLQIPQYLLAFEATSPSFSGMLLQFLMSKIEEVGDSDAVRSNILLRLFKLAFMAVNLFATQNEHILQPHLATIITKIFQLARTAKEPKNYFLLLRSVNRSIGSGRFERLYQDIVPHIETMLEVLNSLLSAAREPAERELYVELALTIPARLNNLLPHLSYLMRPMVVALRSSQDLIGQGLRTLELCVDNLTADYLDPIVAPVMDDLMRALWDHLKPTPYNHFHAHTTMRILGKLGGRNRKNLTGDPLLEYQPYADDPTSIEIRLIGSKHDRAFPIDLGIETAIARLHEVPRHFTAKKADPFLKQQAFKLIVADTKLVLGVDSLPEDFAQLVRLQADDVFSGQYHAAFDIASTSEREKSLAKLDADQKRLKSLLEACIFAMSVPEVRAEAEPFVTSVARHCTLLQLGWALALSRPKSASFSAFDGEGPMHVDSAVIADAIGNSFSSDDIAVREAAEHVLVTIFETAVVAFGSVGRTAKLPFFHHLLLTFCHNCHCEEWFVKSGGVRGLDVVVNKLHLGTEWLLERQTDIVNALSFVVKDMPANLGATTKVHAEALLEDWIRTCYKATSKEEMAVPASRLLRLCGQLVVDLGHWSKPVRRAAQKAFLVLADATHLGPDELIKPVKDRLLVSVWAKPIRALPYNAQIAYVDAITFLLQLKHNVIDFNEQLTRVLLECLALAEIDDESLNNKHHDQRTIDSVVELRMTCLRALTVALAHPDFPTTVAQDACLRICGVFFKCVRNRSPEVVEIADQGLARVVTMAPRMHKAVVTSGLSPVLSSVQDHRKISLESLSSLVLLMKRLTGYFKPEMGGALLEQMNKFTDHVSLTKGSFVLLEQFGKMKIVAAIINVFPFLPSAAVEYIPRLVDRVILLEQSMRRAQNSLFRKPLIAFLCLHPEETWADFASAVGDLNKGRFFAQILQHPDAGVLRAAVQDDVPRLLNGLDTPDDAPETAKCQAMINIVHIAYALSMCPETKGWLLRHENARHALLDAAKSLQLKLRAGGIEPELRLAVEDAGRQIMVVSTTYLKQDLDNLDFCLELVQVVASDELLPSSALLHFLFQEMVCHDCVEYRRKVVYRAIDMYASRNVACKVKTFLFRYVVTPIFAIDIQRNWDSLFGPTNGTKLLNRAMTETIHNRLWKPQALTDVSEDAPGFEHSRVELLQLSTLLVKYHHSLIQDARKDVIRCAWNYIRFEDTISKYSAYAFAAFFVHVFDTPVRIILSLYQQLLKAHQAEARGLVLQALDVMAPVLKKRFGGDANLKIPRWANVPRKMLLEDSSNIQQVSLILTFVKRHPHLFFEARESMSSILVDCLPKIAPLPGPSIDAKKTALNFVSLIRTWEERLASEWDASESTSALPQAMNGSDGSHAVMPPRPRAFVANSASRMLLVK